VITLLHGKIMMDVLISNLNFGILLVVCLSFEKIMSLNHHDIVNLFFACVLRILPICSSQVVHHHHQIQSQLLPSSYPSTPICSPQLTSHIPLANSFPPANSPSIYPPYTEIPWAIYFLLPQIIYHIWFIFAYHLVFL
jgi:hypothetical protein